MKHVNLFLVILVAALASLIALTAVGFAIFTSPTSNSPNSSSWMGDMWGNMGGMMGGTPQTSVQNPALPYFGVGFVVLIGVAVVGVGGLAYYVAFPEIRNRAEPLKAEPVRGVDALRQQEKTVSTPFESVVKTLSADERRVVDVLKGHDGKYLQKYIRSEAELSRLQTHRIVARLAERGIVTLEKTGNTNQVLLADWLKQPA